MADQKFLTIPPHLTRRQLARLFSKITVTGNGCWQWCAGKSRSGYGKTNYGSECMPSHRLLFAWLVQPLPKGVGRDIPCLDHLCRNRLCCNPAHLELVLPKVNLLRGNGECAQHARRTHCERGHALTFTKGRRRCLECLQKAQADNYRRKMEGPARDRLMQGYNDRRRARMNGPRREELLAQKRAKYHATKVLKRRQHDGGSVTPSAPDQK